MNDHAFPQLHRMTTGLAAPFFGLGAPAVPDPTVAILDAMSAQVVVDATGAPVAAANQSNLGLYLVDGGPNIPAGATGTVPVITAFLLVYSDAKNAAIAASSILTYFLDFLPSQNQSLVSLGPLANAGQGPALVTAFSTYLQSNLSGITGAAALQMANDFWQFILAWQGAQAAVTGITAPAPAPAPTPTTVPTASNSIPAQSSAVSTLQNSLTSGRALPTTTNNITIAPAAAPASSNLGWILAGIAGVGVIGTLVYLANRSPVGLAEAGEASEGVAAMEMPRRSRRRRSRRR